VAVERIPYFAEQIVDFMKGTEQLILVGASPPVSFFAYPNKPSWCTPENCKILHLAHPHEDGLAALEALADAVKATGQPLHVGPLGRPDLPAGPLDPRTAGQVIGHFLPDGAIISDEGATAGGGVHRFAATIAPHDHLALTGGAIGQGIPVATGAAVACPGRKVVCLHGDGGAMYTLQALWTQAREKLDVTTVIFANRSYAILNIELARVGAGDPGPKTFSMLDLHNPELDWVKLASGMGVEASRATSVGEFASQFGSAMKNRGPRLIEVVL
jgi:acetolactate synthase-1/2/3 large subunit